MPQDDLDPSRYHLPDPLLQQLVTTVNQAQGNHFSVTLYVGGLIVCGTVVGISEWLDEQALLVESASVEGDELVGAMRDKAAGSLLNGIIEPENADPATRIHLINARVHTASGSVGEGLMWRGALLAVDAWHVGELPEAH